MVGLRCRSVVVSRAGSLLVKAMLPKCSCEFTAIRYCLGVVGFLLFLFFFFFLKINIILLIKI